MLKIKGVKEDIEARMMTTKVNNENKTTWCDHLHTCSKWATNSTEKGKSCLFPFISQPI